MGDSPREEHVCWCSSKTDMTHIVLILLVAKACTIDLWRCGMKLVSDTADAILLYVLRKRDTGRWEIIEHKLKLGVNADWRSRQTGEDWNINRCWFIQSTTGFEWFLRWKFKSAPLEIILGYFNRRKISHRANKVSLQRWFANNYSPLHIRCDLQRKVTTPNNHTTMIPSCPIIL